MNPPIDPYKEVVYIVGKTSRLGYFAQYIGGFFCLAIAGYAYGVLRLPTNKTAMDAFALFFLILGIILIKYVEIKVWMASLSITNKRVVLEEGFFSKKYLTISYGSITEITCSQSFFGRLLQYGDLTLHTAGGKQHDLTLLRIGKPKRIKAIVERLMHAQATQEHAHQGYKHHATAQKGGHAHRRQ